nr:DEAD/DEAH box helicase family protein [uncultured Marinifilum sp.]
MCNLKSINYPKSKEYSSGTTHEPIGFYLDALSNSKHFDLLLGYFSSSAINILAYGFTKFLANGGHMRMAINQFLRKEDKEAIVNGLVQEPGEFYGKQLSLTEIKNHLSETGKHFFNCIAWLIAEKRIEVKIIKPKGSPGIAHYKSGIFSDENNQILFKGSCNFTANALFNNLEEIGVKLSWDDSDHFAIQENQEKFDDIFSEEADYIEYLDASEIEEVILNEFGDKDLSDLIKDELVLSQKEDLLSKTSGRTKMKFQKLEKELFKLENSPRFPYPSGPRDYQAEAYENWVKNSHSGIFDMATGTGKTITSLNCLLEEFNRSGKFDALILVPSIALLNQWEQECAKFNFNNVIKIGGGNKWEQALSDYFFRKSMGQNYSAIIISTYNSFTTKKFRKYLPQLDGILIADEAHNMGSKSILKVLPELICEKKIGLSATLERQYDEYGNEKIRGFFNSYPPYTFSYTMQEAIENGVLCEYFYFPHLVYLTEQELEEYEKISKQLSKYYNQDNDTYSKNEIVEILLQKRKRIIHKAQNKLSKFKQVVAKEYEKRGNLKNSLVYAPEGDIDFDIVDEPEFHTNILNQFTKVVRDVNRRMTVSQYTSNTKNRSRILQKFSGGDIQVLTSMKCLDEGVDIPQTELAFFCASTGNPKQFIQRRGRVLRQSEGKTFATIHDLIVVPNLTNEYNANFRMQQSIVRKELERVVNFSFLAINKYHTFEELDELCNHYKLNLFNINNTINNNDKKR